MQYDAAVADLEQALKQGRGKLDASTIAIVESNSNGFVIFDDDF